MKRFYARVIAGAFAVVTLTGAVAAQARSASQTATQLSELTAVISARLNSNTKAKFDDRFRRMAEQRREIMLQLAEADPAAALRNALPEQALAKMPSDIASLFEKRGTFSGELAVEAECEENNYRTLRTLKSGDSSKQLYLDADPTTELKTGDQITVQGYDLNGKILASAENTAVTATAALTGTTGEKRVLVILVNFQDKATQPFTVEQARDVTFNQTSNFVRENSYGQTWLTGDVYGWYTIPVSSTVCDIASIANYGKQAAANSGADLSSYGHIIYGFPRNACPFNGNATVGGSQTQTWVNAWYELGIVAHEFGHNLGLYHSRSLDCGTVALGATCTTTEYGDYFDMMGAGQYAHYNLYQKERLQWVNNGSQPPIQTVLASGTYWIDSYAAPGGSKGLKILKSTDPVTGNRTWYYVERRAASGFDSYLSSYTNIMSGVLIHTGSEADGQGIYVLDMTPETDSWYDPALTVGRTFTDPAAGVSITVLSADSTGASVWIETNAQPCVRANPTVTVSPGQSPWVSPGASFAYSVTVTNNNSGGCGGEGFDLAANFPNTLSGSFQGAYLNLTNGASGTATLNVSTTAGVADGTYNFGVRASSASNSSFNSTATASLVQVSRLSVAAAANSLKYSRTQTASVSATVKAAGSPVGSATVVFTMTKPDGATVTQTVMSGADGKATFSYRFDRKRDLTGTYSVAVAASVKSYSGQVTTSFSVTK